jgi:uncharacterized protein involved in type VI secretion and phage assembly
LTLKLLAPSTLAGKQRGVFFMPEIDDEVLVALSTQFHHPYIVGYLWNGVDMLPESDLANRDQTPGGHTLCRRR